MLRKDAKHSRITLPDGGAPVKLSSPTTRLTHHQPGFFVLSPYRGFLPSIWKSHEVSGEHI